MKSILDPGFKYVPAVETDIRKTFTRIRREAAAAKPKPAKITQLKPPLKGEQR